MICMQHIPSLQIRRNLNKFLGGAPGGISKDTKRINSNPFPGQSGSIQSGRKEKGNKYHDYVRCDIVDAVVVVVVVNDDDDDDDDVVVGLHFKTTHQGQGGGGIDRQTDGHVLKQECTKKKKN